MVDCIYSPHCTWKQCDYACPIFAEISYWMERCTIDIRNPVLKSDQAAINKGIEIIEGGTGKLSVFRSKSPETATDTLAYCAICLHGRGTALKKGIYVLNYAEYIADYASLGDFCTNVQKHPPSRRRRDLFQSNYGSLV